MKHTRIYRPLLTKLVILLFIGLTNVAGAQKVVVLGSERQHIFSYAEIECFRDTTNQSAITTVTNPPVSSRFQPSGIFTPKTTDFRSTYWYRVRIKIGQPTDRKWLLEFYDQTIDHITLFVPDGKNGYHKKQFGAQFPFPDRLLYHKNFTTEINDSLPGEQVYYFAIQSRQPANVMVVVKSIDWFIQYGLKEYFLSGLFYGMILVFCLYNLVMFFAFRQRQYLYYIAYNLSIGFFEMSSNGFAYQYLWPGSPDWNEIAYGIALFTASISSLLFTRSFLLLRYRAPRLDRLLLWLIALRSVYFMGCLLVNQQWFIYKYIDAVPLLAAFYAGCYIYKRGYFPARFFVAGYSFLLLGFLIRTLKAVASVNLPFGPANFYSLSFCFLMEMLFVSFAIGDRVAWLKRKKELVQKKVIEEMHLNQQLKDNLNRELEAQVQERTREVLDKSAHIEQQNEELLALNQILQRQAEEITRMNQLLSQDNQTLEVHIKKTKEARVLSAEMSFEEFSAIYGDDEACFQLLANLKWEAGYTCRKCGHTSFTHGNLPYSRRCSRCSYDESPTMNTLFQNAHIPLNKGFYILYMVYISKGKVSSYKLSELLSIRQGTCWTYSNKVKKLMAERKKELKNAGEKGWSRLVID